MTLNKERIRCVYDSGVLLLMFTLHLKVIVELTGKFDEIVVSEGLILTLMEGNSSLPPSIYLHSC
jgi:hypothetical protein